jgi:hypothetical protein
MLIVGKDFQECDLVVDLKEIILRTKSILENLGLKCREIPNADGSTELAFQNPDGLVPNAYIKIKFSIGNHREMQKAFLISIKMDAILPALKIVYLQEREEESVSRTPKPITLSGWYGGVDKTIKHLFFLLVSREFIF